MSAFSAAVGAIRSGADADSAARALLDQLTSGEKLGLLDGDEPFWPGMPDMMGKGYNLEPIVAGALDRLGIPGIRFADGPRGAVIGNSTAFPVPMARGATWDPELEERVGEAIGAEISAQGGNFFGGVCINLLRHPAWGRAQETYGEDPLLLGAMGAALARGAQRYVMACVKHYACNSMENARFSVDVQVAAADLHEVFLPHFRAVIDAGVASVMSAYNSVNGEWCGQNRTLLNDILRDEWGFEGFVVSDFIWGLRDPVRSLRAGLDIEMPFAQQRVRVLPDAAAQFPDEIDLACMRILRTQLTFAARVAEAPARSVVACTAHRELARSVAAQSMVLLRNEPVAGHPVLPLEAAGLQRVVVLGRFADVANLGDHGSSDVRAPHAVTALAGLRAALPGVDIRHSDDPDTAASADAALVVVGYDAADEGEYVGSFNADLAALYPPADDPAALDELTRVWDSGPQSIGGDRDSLRLHESDVDLIRAVAAVNPRTIVAIIAGAAVTVSEWHHDVAAILLIWYPGMEGGHALADVLLGTASPGGRLPFAVPEAAADLPPFDKNATSVTYDRWLGQRLLDRAGKRAAYPLGFGLSYSPLSIRDVAVSADETALTVTATVHNAGSRDDAHVAQVYARRGDERSLIGFARVPVTAGMAAPVDIAIPLSRLAKRRAPGDWLVPPGNYQIDVGANAADPDATSVTLELGSA